MEEKNDTMIENEVIDEVPTSEEMLAAVKEVETEGIELKQDEQTFETELPSAAKEAMNNWEHNNKVAQEIIQKERQDEELRINSMQMQQTVSKNEPVQEQTIAKDIEQEEVKHAGGRPTKMTKDILQKLRQGFLMGFTDEEACLFADIVPATLYNYQKKNPEYLEDKELWKQNPILKAKAAIYNSLSDPRISAWYLERRKKDEFSTRTEHTGKDGEDLPPIRIEYVTPTDTVRTNKDSLRSDNETTSSVDVVNGSDN